MSRALMIDAGGAQNIKLKPKEKEAPKEKEKRGFKALKGIAGLVRRFVRHAVS